MTIEEFKYLYRRPLEEIVTKFLRLSFPFGNPKSGPVTDDEIDEAILILQAYAATDAMYREEARQRRLEQVEWKRKENEEAKRNAPRAAAREAEIDAHIRRVVSLHETPFRNTRQSRANRKRQIKALGIPI